MFRYLLVTSIGFPGIQAPGHNKYAPLKDIQLLRTTRQVAGFVHEKRTEDQSQYSPNTIEPTRMVFKCSLFVSGQVIDTRQGIGTNNPDKPTPVGLRTLPVYFSPYSFTIMYARIIQVPIRPEAVAQATAYYRDSVAPPLRKQKGFQSARFLVDSSNDRCLFVTLWDSEEARTKAETDGLLADVLTPMQKYFAGQPTIDFYEVVGEIK